MNQILPKVLPVNELKNTANIMKTCQESTVPIVITKNGYGEAKTNSSTDFVNVPDGIAEELPF